MKHFGIFSHLSLGVTACLLAFSPSLAYEAATSTIDDSVCVWSTSALGCVPKGVCAYRYDKGDLTLSQSCRVAPGANKAPQQIHLAYAGASTGTGMTVSWATYDQVTDSALWIGSTASNLAKVSTTVSSKSYYSDSTYSLYQYHATANGLTPHTKYYYKVGSESDTTLQSDVYTFTTARPVSDSSAFTVAVYGDAGDGDNSADTISLVNSLSTTVDFVYHIGDISYADDDYLVASQVSGFFYEEVYNKWMNSLTAIMTAVPYMVTVGNHEAECHSPACQLSQTKKDALGNYTAYNARFKMPSSESGGVLNMWHSFNHGPLHVTSISSETDYDGFPSNEYTLTNHNGNFGDQLAWLEADLQKANANRANVPWIIVGMHRPMYYQGDADANGVPVDQALKIQAAFEELFIKYKVDVIVAGHEHSYERQLPIAKNSAVTTGVSSDKKTYTNPQAPVYIVTGAAGNVESHTDASSNTAAWNAFGDYTNFGITTVQVTHSTLTWQFIASDSKAVLDSFVMTKTS